MRINKIKPNYKSRYRNPKQARNHKFEIRKNKSLFGICNLWLRICLGFCASCFGFEVNPRRSRGFTLIELLVSLALFSIFLVAVMGAIFTIIDTNKKARSLMTVMNNLSFAVDGMVRSFKTGVNPRLIGNDCFTTNRLDYGHNDFDIDDIQRESATFCFREVEGQGKITLSIGSFQTDYTSPDIDIDYMRFDLDGENADGRQPRLLINIEGTAKISEKISSNFAIQTTVSQSKIDS